MTELKSVGILSTGSEILEGLYADRNASWLAERLTRAGLDVKLMIAAPDDRPMLKAALEQFANTVDIIISTGGLGPTEDDVCRWVMADVFGWTLVSHQNSIQSMEERFRRNGRVMPENNKVQALLPHQAHVLPNDWGTAPGFFMDAGVKPKSPALIALPGPPKEMQPMWEKYAEPLLLARCGGEGNLCRTRTLHTFGKPESEINHRVAAHFQCETGRRMTILAKTYGIDLRYSVRGNQEADVETELAAWELIIRDCLDTDDIYGVDDDSLSTVCARILTDRKISLSVAESLTGGLLAKTLTDSPGSGDFFLGGFLTYAVEEKNKLLGVRQETLDKHGAVSAECAREMAEQCRIKTGADLALATTGNAGPDGAEGKPVGLVYVALADKDKCEVRELHLGAAREQNRLTTVQNALDMLRRYLISRR